MNQAKMKKSPAGQLEPRFERYSEDFNPQNGMDGIEVWIPIKA